MLNVPANPGRLKVIWSPEAQAQYDATLLRIGAQDTPTADLLRQRVQHALALLEHQPYLGTPTASHTVRRFPIPKTGHTIEYRMKSNELHIQRWYRQRRKCP